MSLDELLEYLKSALANPGRVIGQLWIAWWLWTTLRNALRRGKPQAPASSTEQQPPVTVEPPSKPASARVAAPSTPARTAVTLRPEPTARKRLPPPPERSDVRWRRALERAYVLRKRVSSQRALRRLEPIVVEHVSDPLQVALGQVRKAHAVGGSEQRGAGALLALEVLERVLAERAREADAARLAQADAIADAVHAPLRQYAETEDLALRGRHALAIRAPLPAAANAQDWTDQLLLMPVPEAFGAQLDDYTTLVHQLGRHWFSALPGLAEQCRAALRLRAERLLPDEQVGYDESSVHACFGPWLQSLFADTALTLRLGAGYVAGLQRNLADAVNLTRATADGAHLGTEPPALLRMHAALTALSALGQHVAAQRQQKAFAAAHPALEQSFLPLNTGRFMALDSRYLLAINDAVSAVLRTTPFSALGGIPLSEVPGFSQTLEDAHEQQALALAIAHGALPDHVDPAQLLCAALLAAESSDPQLCLRQLDKALLPRAEPVSVVARGAALDETRARRSLRAAFRDPRALRSAIVLGAAFEAPRFRKPMRSGSRP